MRTLKYAILGLLNRRSMTGYDLMKDFNLDLVNFWYARHSQIYPELKKLTDEGLITYETIIQGERMEKKLYSITQQGQKDFAAWILEKDLLEPTPKDIFRLKTYFIEAMELDQMIDHFEYQLEQREEKLKKLKNTMDHHPFTKGWVKIGTTKYGDYIVLKGAVMREQTYIQWLKECIEEMQCGILKK
ncbi:PadR family transcriptional regulator [Alkalibacter rhizosphaerae]|uniref:PadR family transcriptional regulator n=1 Tax=Alkalibacter rhizosphaerae TaxID=2815577 RepID=A0A974XHG3_9FIRM|nr:PadR family transcriptional regulator [Alkalibacter rhizosphaerae]QSX08433.1 PadR family transcriptional regulator [Alkalibacter rhizosphaerae]